MVQGDGTGEPHREFLDYGDTGKTEFAEDFAQERLGKGKRTLYRYTKAYQEASAWADRLHKQDGGNYEFFKVLCLCRKPKEAGTFPSFTPEVRQVIKNIWFNKDFARNQGTREMLYTKLQAVANVNGWTKIPSYQSVTRYISYLISVLVMVVKEIIVEASYILLNHVLLRVSHQMYLNI